MPFSKYFQKIEKTYDTAPLEAGFFYRDTIAYTRGSQTGVNIPLWVKSTCLRGKFCMQTIHTFTYYANGLPVSF